MRNPFNQQPLKQLALFSGENNKKCLGEIQRMFSIYSNEINCESVFIHGERGNGKTSILRILNEEVQIQNYVSRIIYLKNDYTSDFVSFFKVLYESIFDYCKENEILEDVINQTEIAFHNPDSKYWIFDFYRKIINSQKSGVPVSIRAEDISNDLKKILAEINRKKNRGVEVGVKLIYFIDEAQNIFGNAEILNCLRHLIQEEIGVSFVLACQFPYDHANLNKVFGDLSRCFKIYRLDGFTSEKDVKDYIERALNSIGWSENDQRVRVQNINKIVENIFKITNGKVAFVIKVLNKMFEKIILGDDNKMRFNDPLLDEIAQDLLSSSGLVTGDSFNNLRARGIIELDSQDLDWFRFLVSNFHDSTPNAIYDLYFVFFQRPYNSKEYFVELFNKFIRMGCFRLNENNEINFESGADLLTANYYYSGCEEEKYWIQIKLALKNQHLSFGQTFFTTTFLDEIIKKVKVKRVFSVDIQNFTRDLPLIINEEGITYNSIEQFSFEGFLNNINSYKENLSETSESLILFIDNVFSILEKSLRIGCMSLSVSGSKPLGYRHLIYMKPFDQNELEKIVEVYNSKLKVAGIYKLEFVIESLEEIDFKRKDFLKLLSSCSNKKGFLFLSREVLDSTKKIYLNNVNLDSLETNEVINNLDFLHESVNSGYFDREINIINDVGYMLIKYNKEKAFNCFEYALKLEKSIRDSDWINLEQKEYYRFVYYNLAVLLAVDGNLALAIDYLSTSLANVRVNEEPASLYCLVVSEEGVITFEEHFDVSLKKMINKNLELLRKRLPAKELEG